MWGAAWSLHEAGDPAAEDWVAARALAVLAGDSDRAAQEIAAEAGAAGLAGSQRNGAAACVRYLVQPLVSSLLVADVGDGYFW